MAAIVATLTFAPLAAALAALSFVTPDVTLRDMLTFGGALNTLLGPLAWWSILFVAALAGPEARWRPYSGAHTQTCLRRPWFQLSAITPATCLPFPTPVESPMK